MEELGYNLSYVIKTNNVTKKAYVYIFKANLKPMEFGLKTPSNSMDNQNNQNLNCNKIMKNKKIIRLTESDLHNVIKESVQEALNDMIYEGQGWDLFKRARTGYKNNDIDPREYCQNRNTDRHKQSKQNFVNHGTEDGNDEDTGYC